MLAKTRAGWGLWVLIAAAGCAGASQTPRAGAGVARGTWGPFRLGTVGAIPEAKSPGLSFCFAHRRRATNPAGASGNIPFSLGRSGTG